MASSGLTAHTQAEVKDLEQRFKEQGYLPFHRAQANGTWKVYQGKQVAKVPGLIENISEEDLTREMMKKLYVPKEKKVEPSQEKVVKVKKQATQQSQLSGDVKVKVYGNEKEANEAESRAKLLGAEAYASQTTDKQWTVILKGDKAEEVSNKLDEPPTQEEQEQVWKMQATEKKKQRDIEKEILKEQPEEFKKELEEKTRNARYQKEYERRTEPLTERISRYKKNVSNVIDPAGGDIKSTIAYYNKSRNMKLSDAEISKGINAGIEEQTRIVKPSGRPEIGTNTSGDINQSSIKQVPNLSYLRKGINTRTKGFADI